MPIKKNDFVEIEYTGRLKDGKIVFDTTDEKVAKAEGFAQERAVYGPVIVCVGQQHLVKGLDAFLEGKDAGKFNVEIAPEDAFGKKDVKLIAMIPARKFLEQKIRPVPGLQVNIDGIMGVIRTVNSGRTIVDFNHPLAGKTVVYDIKINHVVADKKETVEALARLSFGKNVVVTLDANTAKVESAQDVPEQIADEFKKKFKELVGTDLLFVKPEEKSAETKEEKKQTAKNNVQNA